MSAASASPYPLPGVACFSLPAFPLMSQRLQPNSQTEPHEDICHQEDSQPQGATHLAAGGCPTDPTDTVKDSGRPLEFILTSATPLQLWPWRLLQTSSCQKATYCPPLGLQGGLCVCSAWKPSLDLVGNSRTMFKSRGHHENRRVVSRACAYVSVTYVKLNLEQLLGSLAPAGQYVLL